MPSRLFEPLTLPSGAILKNRVALAPLTNQQSHDDGTLSADEERREIPAFLRKQPD